MEGIHLCWFDSRLQLTYYFLFAKENDEDDLIRMIDDAINNNKFDLIP